MDLRGRTNHYDTSSAERTSVEELGTFQALILSHVNDAVIAIDNSGCITYFNRAAEHLYGISGDQALKRPLQEIYTYRWVRPEDEAEATDALERTGFWRGENIHIRGDGVTLWVESAVSVLKNADSLPTGLLAVIRNISQRKRAEAALRASEERLRTALEIDTVGVIIFRPEGPITGANLAFQRMSQFSHDDVVQGHVRWDGMTPEEFMPASLRAVEELVTTGKTSPYEKQYIRKDGTRFWGLFAAKLLGDGEGVEFILDISDRKQAEAALREREDRLHTLADAVPQLIWTNDAEGKANYFNQRWYDYSGLSYDQSSGLGWQVIVHPDDAPASVERWQRALSAGEMFDTEYRLRRADGVYRWHLGRNVPLRNGDGQITGWFGTATDIEDLKQGEAALRESEERFRLLVEGARDYAMYLLDPENHITFWSAGAERVFGYTEAEALGQSGALVFTPEDRARGEPEREVDTARSNGRAEDQRWHLKQDGSRFWADGVLIRLNDQDGKLRGFVKITRDATLRKQAEIALQRAHDVLERRVEERTAALTATNEALQREIAERTQVEAERAALMERLISAQEDERRRIARELHDSLGQFLAALTIRLSALQGTAGDLPAVNAGIADLREVASQIDRELDRLTMELRPPALDDLGLVDALRAYVEEWQATSGITVDVLVQGLEDTHLPAVVEASIYRIVQEVLTNVLKHAQATRVSIILERRPQELQLIVEDNGRGFDMESVRRERSSGRHLGLIGISERAALAGGALSIESEPGGGTTIYLQIPMQQAIDGAGDTSDG
jgi:PAS domain S-box-containing protein